MRTLEFLLVLLLTLLVIIALAIVFLKPIDRELERVDRPDFECLEDYARDFCLYEENRPGARSHVNEEPVDITEDSFHCLVKDLPRERSQRISTRYYFSEGEKLDCTITKFLMERR